MGSIAMTGRPGPRRRLAGLVIAAGMLAAGTAAAAAPARPGAASPAVTAVRDVASRSQFTRQGCNVATSPGGREATPFIAVNPDNPRNWIAVWMDATRATVDTACTTDAGRIWHVVIQQGTDSCTGNKTDQWEPAVVVLCAYEPAAIASGRLSTTSMLCRRRRWVEAGLLAVLLARLHNQLAAGPAPSPVGAAS